MKLQGIGMVSALGRGIETFQSALENGPVEPSRIEVPFQESLFPVYAVAKETLKDPILRVPTVFLKWQHWPPLMQ